MVAHDSPRSPPQRGRGTGSPPQCAGGAAHAHDHSSGSPRHWRSYSLSEFPTPGDRHRRFRTHGARGDAHARARAVLPHAAAAAARRARGRRPVPPSCSSAEEPPPRRPRSCRYRTSEQGAPAEAAHTRRARQRDLRDVRPRSAGRSRSVPARADGLNSPSATLYADRAACSRPCVCSPSQIAAPLRHAREPSRISARWRCRCRRWRSQRLNDLAACRLAGLRAKRARRWNFRPWLPRAVDHTRAAVQPRPRSASAPPAPQPFAVLEPPIPGISDGGDLREAVARLLAG